MPMVLDEILQVRASPRPDALRWGSTQMWARALPSALFAIGAALACLLLDTRDLGLVACAVAVWAVASRVASMRWAETGYRLHLTAGLFALGLLRSAGDAGEFAPAAAILVLAALVARAATADARRTIAPMSARVPSGFLQRYRSHALRYGAVGLGVGLLLILVAPNPILKIIGVACLPLALRTFALQLLTPRKSQALWWMAALFHLAALAAFVPAHGAVAAAWIAVLAEVMLLVGAVIVIAHSMSAAPFPRRTLAVGGGSLLLVCSLAVPGTGIWPMLVTAVVAAIVGVFYWPSRT